MTYQARDEFRLNETEARSSGIRTVENHRLLQDCVQYESVFLKRFETRDTGADFLGYRSLAKPTALTILRIQTFLVKHYILSITDRGPQHPFLPLSMSKRFGNGPPTPASKPKHCQNAAPVQAYPPYCLLHTEEWSTTTARRMATSLTSRQP